MKRKIFIICLILIALFCINFSFAENFTDLNNEIDGNDFVSINSDVVLNHNTAGEDTKFDEGILIENRQIDIDANNHTICAMDSGGKQTRLFNIKNSNVTLSNMVIESAAHDGSGGAIVLDSNSTLVLRNTVFRNNSALGIYGEGGAIYSLGNIYVYDSLFENNYASGAAGAVHVPFKNCSIQSSKFINNTAKWYGGALYSGNFMDVKSSLFENNHAYSGGAFHYVLDCRVKIFGDALFSHCDFAANEANDGAAISIATFSPAYFEECNFIANRADRGAVLYINSAPESNFIRCLLENNSARLGALFYIDSYEGDLEYPGGFVNVSESIMNNNVVSDKGSILYARGGNILINHSVISNNLNYPIYLGKGDIGVLNSNISNYGNNFITQFIGGKIAVENNEWDLGKSDYGQMLDYGDDSLVYTEGSHDLLNMGFMMATPEGGYIDRHSADLSECCSVYVRVNSTCYALSHRRDGGVINYTLCIDKNGGYIKEFKPFAECYFLSKVYENGWVIGTGGWDDSAQNEKVEAIASDMALNGNISLEALRMILDVKNLCDVGHLLIVAPDGTYGNVIVRFDNLFIGMGVLDDGGYIVSPNDPVYRQEGKLSDIDDVVLQNINLSVRDGYGYNRHCVVVHHVNLNENGFSDSIHVSNEDGRFINQTNGIYCDPVWFEENFFPSNIILTALDSLHIGTCYRLNRTVVSQDAAVGYGSDYLFKVQLFNSDGSFLANVDVNVTVNAKSTICVTNKQGIITIPFAALTSSQSICIINPATGDKVENTINVVPRLVGSNVVMDYFDGSKYAVKVYGTDGKSAGKNQIVTVKINKKTYKIKTDSKGMASLTIPNTLTPKTYVLTATYAGQSIKNNVKVRQTLKTANAVTKKSSKRLVLKATLKTTKNKPIKNKKIVFKFRGKTYWAKTSSKGIAKITISKKVLSKLKVGNKYVFNVSYLKDTIKATVKVKR